MLWFASRLMSRVVSRAGLTRKKPTAAMIPTVTKSRIMPAVTLPKRFRRTSMRCAETILPSSGEGHREANSPALVDLVPDGSGEAGFGPRDQARGGGLQRHERRRFRAPFLCRSRRAGEPRDPARGREARRGVLRGRALLAAAGELLPRPDLLLR